MRRLSNGPTTPFNPWIGCQKVSAGCDNCYAETMAKRRGWHAWDGSERRPMSESYWWQPLRWDRKAAEAGERHRVFCASLADVFDPKAPPEIRERLWTLIAETPNLDWLVLSKRPERFAEFLPDDWGSGYPNVWLGISAEDQDNYERRWPTLAATPAVLRFVSYEPALGPLVLGGGDTDEVHPDWVIAGGESGPGARPMRPSWFRGVIADCAALEIPMFLKQWGTYASSPLVVNAGLSVREAKQLDPPGNGKGGAMLGGRLIREFPR